MSKSYTYDPVNAGTYGKDRMRFELGDTMVEGGEDTCALCAEEYAAIIPDKVYTKRQWKKLKLRCLESIMHRFAYEPDTKVGPLQLSLTSRAKLWQDMYNALKDELSKSGASSASILLNANNPDTGAITRPYFYNGMMSHEEEEGEDI